MRCLLDASVVLTYLASPAAERTAVFQILRAAVGGTVVLLWPTELASEIERTAGRRRSIRNRVGETAASDMLEFLGSIGAPVPRTIGPPEPVCRDPNDDCIVASALAGRADLVVTLDDDLLALGEHAGIRFVKPGGALAILREARLLPEE